jgi:hypothetical protein
MELNEKKKKKRPQRGRKGMMRVQPARDIKIEGPLLEEGQSGLDLVRRKKEIIEQRRSSREIAAKAKLYKQSAEGDRLEKLEEIRAEYAKKSRDLKKELKDVNKRIEVLKSPVKNPVTGKIGRPTLGKQADEELEKLEQSLRMERMAREEAAREGAKEMPVPEPTERFGKETFVKFRGKDTVGTVMKKDPEKVKEEMMFPPKEKLQQVEVTEFTEEELAEEKPVSSVPERIRKISGRQGQRAERAQEKERKEEVKEFMQEMKEKPAPKQTTQKPQKKGFQKITNEPKDEIQANFFIRMEDE